MKFNNIDTRDKYNYPFENGKLDIFECRLPFTHKSRHSRMCACIGVLASMDNKASEEHLKLLSDYPEGFEIKHKLYIASYKISK